MLQTTAGWRKAPAPAQRVCTRGLARISSISLKNTMNTAGLEWFGPPERNTLHPLCVVLPCLERVCESLVLSPACVCVCSREPPVYSERLPFISQGGRVHGRWVPDRWAQLMQYNITYCSYIMALQAKEISLRDFLAFSWNLTFSMTRRCLVE